LARIDESRIENVDDNELSFIYDPQLLSNDQRALFVNVVKAKDEEIRLLKQEAVALQNPDRTSESPLKT